MGPTACTPETETAMRSLYHLVFPALLFLALLLHSFAIAADFDHPDYRAVVTAASAPLTVARLDAGLWALNPDYTAPPAVRRPGPRAHGHLDRG